MPEGARSSLDLCGRDDSGIAVLLSGTVCILLTSHSNKASNQWSSVGQVTPTSAMRTISTMVEGILGLWEAGALETVANSSERDLGP